MPRGDETGPMGMGKLTGRGAGYCAGSAVPGYANSIGFGCGFRRGRGFGRMPYAAGQPMRTRFGYPEYNGTNETFDEKAFLSNQAEFLENQLQQIKKRLSSFNQDNE